MSAAATVRSPVVLLLLLPANSSQPKESWRGLTIAPESRCSEYDPDDYPYPQSVENPVIAQLGGRVFPLHRRMVRRQV